MIAPARAAAFRALRAIESGRADLGEALVRSRDPLRDTRDRALATELVTGTLRWRAALDYQLALRSGRPLARLDPAVLEALRLAAFQLLHLARVPASAVVNDAVAMVRGARVASAAGFANAMLRRLARERDRLEWPPRPEGRTGAHRDAWIEHLSTLESHPAWLVARWIDRYGVEEAEQWLRFNNLVPAVTVATNRLVTTREALAARLAAENIEARPTSIAPHGLTIIHGRPVGSAAYRDGACLVQDEASQLIPELVGAARGDRVLDACASPGGKTVALAAQAGAEGLVIACDVRPRRVRVLAQTLARCQVPNAPVVHIPEHGALPFADGSLARVLVDAPCSGLGTLRREPDIRWRRQPADLPRLAAAQVDLLARVSTLVAPGGRLVYGTCSSEPEENEQVVEAFLAAATEFRLRPLPSLAEVPPSIRALASPEGFLRTDPARHGLEAFFGAVLARRHDG